MRRRSARACLLAALFACIPLSCFKSSSNTNSIKRNPPTDPLLQSKCPVTARYGTTSDVNPRPDPAPPTIPAGAWLQNPAQPSLGTAEPKPPAPFRWTSEKRELTPEGKTRTLEGRLEKNGEQWLLRTDEVAEGKVLVEGHPQLDLFEAGDKIRVEGRVTREARSGTPWLPFRSFVVDHVQLVQRGR